MSNGAVTLHLALSPRDGLFIKDARGWHAIGRARTHRWPPPQTLLGALRASYGRQLEQLDGRRLSPSQWLTETAQVELGATLAIRRPLGQPLAPSQRMWPVPADALALEGQPQLHRLDPRPAALPTLGLTDDPVREALWWPRLDDQSKPEPLPNWWTEEELVAWLTGRQVGKRAREAWLDPPTRLDVRVGIDRASGTAEDGRLFALEVVETLGSAAEWLVACQVNLPQPLGVGREPVTLGGGQRLALAELADAALFGPPAALTTALANGTPGLRLVVVSPTLFARGWLPDGLTEQAGEYRGTLWEAGPEVVLRAAFGPRPQHVAGWDIARRQPKPTLRLVPPGAIYFIERADQQPFDAAQAQACWLAPWGERQAEGYGRVVPGIWNPRSNS